MSDEGLKILFLAAEAVPFAKVGGLADVAGALPKALRALGHDVRLMIPRYGSIRSNDFQFQKVGKPFQVPVGPDEEYVHLVETTTGGDVPVYLIWDEKFFSPRERVYGFDDDAQRFTFFGRAVAAALPIIDWVPDVIHANDWHTAVTPTWLAYEGRYLPQFRHPASLFTVHNLAYQGISGRLILTFARMEYVKHLEIEPPGQVNWMAQGIANADLVSTVSPTYAREILEPDAGAGLAPLLQKRQDRLVGILNGIDYDLWNPASDPHIPQRFDLSSLNMRAVNKASLQREARIPARADVPLIGMVGRLDYVKGADLLGPILERLLE
jgi:starch synthase